MLSSFISHTRRTEARFRVVKIVPTVLIGDVFFTHHQTLLEFRINPHFVYDLILQAGGMAQFTNETVQFMKTATVLYVPSIYKMQPAIERQDKLLSAAVLYASVIHTSKPGIGVPYSTYCARLTDTARLVICCPCITGTTSLTSSSSSRQGQSTVRLVVPVPGCARLCQSTVAHLRHSHA